MQLHNIPMTPRKAVKDFIKESAKKWRQQQKSSAPKPAAEP
jgi:hypothetical protein